MPNTKQNKDYKCVHLIFILSFKSADKWNETNWNSIPSDKWNIPIFETWTPIRFESLFIPDTDYPVIKI